MTAEALDIRLLGQLELLVDGRLLALGGARQRALFALLALRAGELVTGDRLIDDLWGDEATANAPNALAAVVARLRKVLPDGLLVTQPAGYELRVEPETIDLVRFERLLAEASAAEAEDAAPLLAAALELWRGPALAEFAYEPWAQPAIGRLEELRLAATEARIDADLATGGGADLVGELEALVRAHPLREHLRAQLMLALYRAGRQADALAAYRDARTTLVDELGIEPGGELQELEQSILRHDTSLEPLRPAAARRAVLACALDHTRAPSLLALAAPLVKRSDRELILVLVADPAALSEATRSAGALADRAAGDGVPTRAAAFTSDEPGDDVLKLLREHQVDLLVVDAPADRSPRFARERARTGALRCRGAVRRAGRLGPAGDRAVRRRRARSGPRSRSVPGSPARPGPSFAWPGRPPARDGATRAGCWRPRPSSSRTPPASPRSPYSSSRARRASSTPRARRRSSSSACRTAGARRGWGRPAAPSPKGRMRLCSSSAAA